MTKILLVGIGGFLGAVSRFGVYTLARYFLSDSFPFATLAINAVGSASLGLLFEVFRDHPLLPTMTLFAGIGFLGSFTTFSAFSFETVELWKRGNLQLAAFNVLGNIVFCLGAVFVGEWVGRFLKS